MYDAVLAFNVLHLMTDLDDALKAAGGAAPRRVADLHLMSDLDDALGQLVKDP